MLTAFHLRALAFVLAFLVLPKAALAQSRQYRAEVIFDRTYAKPAELRKIATLSGLLLPTETRTSKQQSISQTIVDLYGLGKSNGSTLYEQFYTGIVRLNNLNPELDIPAGKALLVPTAPYWSPPVGFSEQDRTLGWNHTLAKNRVALPIEGSLESTARLRSDTLARVAGKGLIAFSDDWRTPQMAAKNTVAAALTFRFSDPRVVSTDPQRLSEFALLLDGPFDVDLQGAGDGRPDPDDDVFSLLDAERVAVDGAIARAMKRDAKVPLVVLDFEWPNVATAQRSATWIYGLLSEERAAHGWGAISAPRIPSTLALSRFPHSLAIQDAIDPLTRRDTAGAVPIIYVPLIATAGADTLLIDLVATYFAARRAAGSQADAPLDRSYKDAAELVHSLPAVAGADASTVLFTSRVIIDALLFILDQHARRTRVPYVLNASWILAQPVSIAPAISAPVMGLIVASTGNKDEDVMTAERDLARWSNEGRTPLSVANFSSADKRTCQSSYFADTSAAIARLHTVVAYRGGRASSGLYRCGTSFSAPRVGWFLALFFATQGRVQNAGLTTWSTFAWNNIDRAAQGSGIRAFRPALLLKP